MRRAVILFVFLSLATLSCNLSVDAGTTDAQATTEALANQLTAASNTQLAVQTANIVPTNTLEPSQPTATGIPPTNTSAPPTNTQAPPTETPYVVPDWPLVRQGDQGPEVYALQYLLRAHGYDLTADGQFGPITRSRVMAFQTDKGLQVDGIVGPQTWGALIGGQTVQQGRTGPEVRAAQHLLRFKFGYSDVVVDGIFGPITDAAVVDFQTDYDLLVDGIVGPQTWQALIAIEP